MSRNRRWSDDTTPARPTFFRWVRVHEDPKTRYTYVYLVGSPAGDLPSLKLDLVHSADPEGDLIAEVRTFLKGRVCLACGKELTNNDDLCAKCRAGAIKDLRGLLDD